MKMNPRILIFLAVFCTPFIALAQAVEGTGTVSYITSQSIYVKFKTTEGINPGDTLFISTAGILKPAMIVKERSSISCVCTPLPGIIVKTGDALISRTGVKPKVKTEIKQDSVIPAPFVAVPAVTAPDTMTSHRDVINNRQSIHGNLSISSYSNFSNSPEGNSQKMKYTFSMLAKNIGNSNLSADCYISYNQNNNQWNENENSIFNQLKIYSLAFNYDFGPKASLILGRKINPKLTNMGANDGLQFEYRLKRNFSFGIIAGFRPDYADYGFNADLFQAGAYVYHEYAGKKGMMQSTVAFVDQTNSWKTDRRFIYFQHANSLVKNITFFGTAELDLYKQVYNQADSSWTSQGTFGLTNLYLSLNYRIIKQLSLSFSYSNRKNVIYYETYKSRLEELIDPQATQGYMLQVTTRPVNNLSIGISGVYRFQNADLRPTRNLYGYITYSRVPGIGVSVTGSVTILETSYLVGNIYSIGLSRDFAHGKFYSSVNYRYVDYDYANQELKLVQNMGDISLTWRIWKKLALSAYYEGTFQGDFTFSRVYAQLSLGF